MEADDWHWPPMKETVQRRIRRNRRQQQIPFSVSSYKEVSCKWKGNASPIVNKCQSNKKKFKGTAKKRNPMFCPHIVKLVVNLVLYLNKT